MISLRLTCPRCARRHSPAVKLAWRAGLRTSCPHCETPWPLDRSLVWAVTSTPAAFAGVYGWLAFGASGMLAAFSSVWMGLELVALLFLRPSSVTRE